MSLSITPQNTIVKSEYNIIGSNLSKGFYEIFKNGRVRQGGNSITNSVATAIVLPIMVPFDATSWLAQGNIVDVNSSGGQSIGILYDTNPGRGLVMSVQGGNLSYYSRSVCWIMEGFKA